MWELMFEIFWILEVARRAHSPSPKYAKATDYSGYLSLHNVNDRWMTLLNVNTGMLIVMYYV